MTAATAFTTYHRVHCAFIALALHALVAQHWHQTREGAARAPPTRLISVASKSAGVKQARAAPRRPAADQAGIPCSRGRCSLANFLGSCSSGGRARFIVVCEFVCLDF